MVSITRRSAPAATAARTWSREELVRLVEGERPHRLEELRRWARCQRQHSGAPAARAHDTAAEKTSSTARRVRRASRRSPQRCWLLPRRRPRPRRRRGRRSPRRASRGSRSSGSSPAARPRSWSCVPIAPSKSRKPSPASAAESSSDASRDVGMALPSSFFSPHPSRTCQRDAPSWPRRASPSQTYTSARGMNV